MCVPGLEIPAGTARIRLQLISRTRTRPALRMALTLGGHGARTLTSALAPVTVPSNRISAAVFTIPRLAAQTSGTSGLAVSDRERSRQLGRHSAARAPQLRAADRRRNTGRRADRRLV